MLSKRELNRRMKFARQRAAQAWCDKATEKLVFDSVLAESFSKLLVEDMYAPHLGCATTGEMLEEISARVDLDYKTLGGK